MKTFEDLLFTEHPLKPSFDNHAVILFSNGYGASVITGRHSYSNSENPYELAVIKGTEDSYSITYSTSISKDVVGNLTEEGITEVLKQIQNLK